MTLFYNLFLFPRGLVVLLLLLTFHVKAQQKEVFKQTSSHVVTIYSRILNEDRKIYIHHPKVDSINGDKRFPVLYLMDGESHFDMLAQYTDYLSRTDVNVIPEMIVVGITNTKRARDLTPTESIINYMGVPDTRPDSWMKPSGGNELFLQFIRDELMPYVQSSYNTHPFKIFAGHSFGGIAAINCMLTHSEMFNAYIALSPSFWWDSGYMLKLADKKLTKGSAFNSIIFYSDGNEGATDASTYHTNLLKFDSLLKQKTITGLDYQYNYYPAETHMTVPVKAYYDALRFIYKDWPAPAQNPNSINTSVFMDHYSRLSQKYGYTILPNENDINEWATYLLTSRETLKSGISLLEMNTVNYPYSSKAFISLGDAYIKLGNKQKAINSYQKAIALNSKNADVKAKLKELGN